MVESSNHKHSGKGKKKQVDYIIDTFCGELGVCGPYGIQTFLLLCAMGMPRDQAYVAAFGEQVKEVPTWEETVDTLYQNYYKVINLIRSQIQHVEPGSVEWAQLKLMAEAADQRNSPKERIRALRELIKSYSEKITMEKLRYQIELIKAEMEEKHMLDVDSAIVIDDLPLEDKKKLAEKILNEGDTSEDTDMEEEVEEA